MAQEIYGSQAAEGPFLENPKILFDRKLHRIIVIGDEVGDGATGASGRPNRLWTFDLREGFWTEVGNLDVPETMSGYSVNVDPLRNRAVLFGGGMVGSDSPMVYNLDLTTLDATELVTVPTSEGPFHLEDHGASFSPTGQALYVYGGWSGTGVSSKAYKLDLITRRWEVYGDGLEGPGPLVKPFVTYNGATGRLWVADKGPGAPAQISYWGLDESGWTQQKVLEQPSVDQWAVEGIFSPSSSNQHHLFVPKDHALPGRLMVVQMSASDPSLGLKLTDTHGSLVGQDVSDATSHRVAFYGRGGYNVEVVASSSYDPTTHPTYTLSLADAELVELASYTEGRRVCQVALRDQMVYLPSRRKLQAVDVSHPDSPTFASSTPLHGRSLDMGFCGDSLCVPQGWGYPNLSMVDISTPGQPVVLGTGHSPGLSRSVAAKGGVTAYTADGLFGVSIWSTADPTQPTKEETLSVPGMATHLEVLENRLYVAGAYPDVVRIYDVTLATSPQLIGEISLTEHVAQMKIMGDELHVVFHDGFLSWIKCLSGLYCERGNEVKVFDVSDPSNAVELGAYNLMEAPAADMISFEGGRVLVRQKKGFRVYKAVDSGQ